ncbi:GGDEF domain-containing protein [Massilia niastensis]|uniref:GGDEF domain-containing protein n=1 Tax=Massilia niastensis TaxID=544911 RepID=UPI000370A1F2|nr:GGDEF domain-containing protein [Massilia niastensis]
MIASASGRVGAWLDRVRGTLDEHDERSLNTQLDQELSHMLPTLGAVFGISIVLFSAWDYWIDSENAGVTTMVRLSLVLIGAIGYVRWPARLPVIWRAILVYGTHVSAMIFSSALLPDGMILALPAITGVMYPLALVEPRPVRLFFIVLAPSLLFLALGATVMPPRIFVSSMAVYLTSLGLMACVAIVNGKHRRVAYAARQALVRSAHYDSLCNVLSRAYLVELAERDLALAQRHNRPLAIAMLDIDFFKRVNDMYGHPVGDMLLREFCKVCSTELRGSDYFGRVGGEEFVCIMPETDADDALACAERMRRAVAAIRLLTPTGTIRCTVSIGVAARDREHSDFSALMSAADAALYRAKAQGRDRVVLSMTPQLDDSNT